MNVQDIVKIALQLISKKDEILALVSEAITLFNKAKELFPGLMKELEGAATPALDMKWLQESLNKLVGANLTVDGNMGQATHDAIKKFQTQYGLVVDGWAGAQTQAAILDALK